MVLAKKTIAHLRNVKGSRLKNYVKDYLVKKGVPFKEFSGSIEAAVPGTDVLYVTRIQKVGCRAISVRDTNFSSGTP